MSCSDETIKKAFDRFDIDGNGTIELKELVRVCDEFVRQRDGAAYDPEKGYEEAKCIAQDIRGADTDGDRRITFDEFRIELLKQMKQ